MFQFNAQNGLGGGYNIANAIVFLDAADTGSLIQNAGGLTRWVDGSGESNDLIAAAGGEPSVGSGGVVFNGNRSMELAIPLFPSSQQGYSEWTMAVLIRPQDQANQYDYAAVFSPSQTAAGSPNFVFVAGGQWGLAQGGAGFPRIGNVTENRDQLVIVSSSRSRNRIVSYVTGTGEVVNTANYIDNAIWNFGICYGMRGVMKLFVFCNAYYTSAERLALRDQISAQTGLTL
jgi:hypothetical protein